MTRRQRAVGAGVGALLAATLVSLCGAALYLHLRNTGEQRLAQLPAQLAARRLARAAATAAPGSEAPQQLAQLIKANAPHVVTAAVVVEPRSTKYRFLRKRRFLAHSDPARHRQPLDRRHAGDKALYDLAGQVRKDGALTHSSATEGKPFQVSAAVPVKRDGKHWATAIVVTHPVVPAPGVPAWPLAVGVVLVGLLGLGAGAATRKRYLAVATAVAGLSAACWWQLGALARFYDEALLRLTGGAGAGAAEGPLTLPSWPLWIATTAALGLTLLGHMGLGHRLTETLRRHRAAYLYLLPAAVGMLVLVFVPFGYGLALGFYNHAHGSYTFVGLDNFREILSGGGRPLSHPLNFYFTLGVTVLWTGLNIVLHVAIGLALALVLKDQKLRFRGLYRVLLILPWAVPNYITALIWKAMFHNQYGAVNQVLDLLGVEKISWFSEFSTAFIANVVTNTWLGFPFMMVVSLGALQSIPSDVYEAAEVDGASRWQMFWNITLPLLRPALYPAVILGTIWTFNMFNIIYLVSAGAPGGSTDILITEAYRWAFERADRYGLASAYAAIILVILLAYTLLTNRATRATEDTSS